MSASRTNFASDCHRRDRERMRSVTAANPCPVCGGDHKCSVGNNGLILCGRQSGHVEGFVHMGASSDPIWHVYRSCEDPLVLDTESRSTFPPKTPQASPRDWFECHKVYREAFSGMRDELSQILGVPGDSLDSVGYGWSDREGVFTLAERDGFGVVIGINRRFHDGSKKQSEGGSRGIVIPDGFERMSGPILLVEGGSDTAAMMAAGVCALGRPSNTGGIAHLANLLRSIESARPIVVVGENDERFDLSKNAMEWPGKKGAELTATKLSESLGRAVSWVMTPDSKKDVRQWLVDRVGADPSPDKWSEAGRILLPKLVVLAGLQPLSARDLITKHPQLRRPLIEGLLRHGETMNLIASPKTGKSWMSSGLAMSLVTGRSWLGFETKPCDVLIIDNELHPETIANRLDKVASSMDIELGEYGDRLFVQPLRGQLRDLNQMADYFDSLPVERFGLIILDSFYRFLPKEDDENSNGDLTHLYNTLDRYAHRLNSSFVLIHHASKGTQVGKNVTDVGAGAGAQSRATDTHVILRPHAVPGVCVLEAAVRSWAPIEPKCLRWDFPLWHLDHEEDPAQLAGSKPKLDPEEAEKKRADKQAAKEAVAERERELLAEEAYQKLIGFPKKSATKNQWKTALGFNTGKMDTAIRMLVLQGRISACEVNRPRGKGTAKVDAYKAVKPRPSDSRTPGQNG